MMGVRGNLVQATEGGPKNASFEFPGLPHCHLQRHRPALRAGSNFQINAYHIHTTDDAGGTRGDIDYAPDQGVNGAANYPTAFDLTSDLKQTQVIVFPCVATSIYDLIDQQALKTLTGVNVYDGATDGEPRQYGFILAGSEPGVSYVEDVAVLFSTPGPDTRLKVVMNSGIGGARFLLINSLNWDESETNLPVNGSAPARTSAPRASATPSASPPPASATMSGPRTRTTRTMLFATARSPIRPCASPKTCGTWTSFASRNLAKFRIVQLHDQTNPLTHLHDLAKEDIDKALAAYAAARL